MEVVGKGGRILLYVRENISFIVGIETFQWICIYCLIDSVQKCLKSLVWKEGVKIDLRRLFVEAFSFQYPALIYNGHEVEELPTVG